LQATTLPTRSTATLAQTGLFHTASHRAESTGDTVPAAGGVRWLMGSVVGRQVNVVSQMEVRAVGTGIRWAWHGPLPLRQSDRVSPKLKWRLRGPAVLHLKCGHARA
jgi:hypothetical protein